MDLPENFYYDVRIRARALAKGLVTQQQVDEYLGALADQESSVDGLTLDQPALMSPDQAPAEVPPPAVPPALATPLAVSSPEPFAPPAPVAPPPAPPPVQSPIAMPYSPPAVEPVSYEDRVTPIATPADLGHPTAVEHQPEAPPAVPQMAEPAESSEPELTASEAETASRPVSVPPAPDLASDGATEVSDAGWETPDEPSGTGGPG